MFLIFSRHQKYVDKTKESVNRRLSYVILNYKFNKSKDLFK